MKIRYIAVVYTLLMLIVLGIFAKEMNETDYKAVDMISINESVKLIENDIKQGMPNVRRFGELASLLRGDT